MKRLARVGAVSGLLAGLLEIVAQFLTHVPDHAGLEALYAAIDTSFLIALTSLIALVAERIALPGLVLLLLALAGVASIVGPDKTVFGIDFYRAGSAVFVLALGGSAIWLARLVAFRRVAQLWGAAALFALLAGASGEALALRATSVMLGIGFLLLGRVMWTLRETDR